MQSLYVSHFTSDAENRKAHTTTMTTQSGIHKVAFLASFTSSLHPFISSSPHLITLYT
jgi:hypothetical protein